MRKMARITMCGLLVLALAAPALAGGVPEKRSTAQKVSGAVYKGGANVLDRTEQLFSGCMKRCFGFFNPCLDVVKSCTNVVLGPIEKPFAYAEDSLAKRLPAGKPAPKVTAPKQ